MTLRITLLVLVTGLFALIWTHDQRPNRQPLSQTAAVAPQEARRTVSILPPNAEKDALGAKVEGPRPAWLDLELSRYTRSSNKGSKEEWAAIPASLRKVSPKKEWKLGDAEMPWPDGLVPGEYRAVSNTGLVQNLTVTLAELQSRQAGPAKYLTQDVYRSQGKTLRWYFIRVQSETGKTFPVIAQRGRHVVRPAVAPRGTHQYKPAVAEKDRSQEFRQQASQIIVGAGQRIFQNIAETLREARPTPWDSVREQIQPTRLSVEETGEKSL